MKPSKEAYPAERNETKMEKYKRLLEETNNRMKQHKASLLDYCPACRDQVKRNDAALRGDDE